MTTSSVVVIGMLLLAAPCLLELLRANFLAAIMAFLRDRAALAFCDL